VKRSFSHDRDIIRALDRVGGFFTEFAS